jgi:hypothetical protein
MVVFEQLGYLIRFGQVIGVVPYSMKTDRLTGEFKRFQFSWCHPITFWCILVIIFQTIHICLALFGFNGKMEQEFSSYKMSKMVVIIMAVGQMDSLVMFFIIRAITFRYSQLQLAAQFLTKQTVKALEELEKLPNCKNSIKLRTLIGISIVITTVRCCLSIS